MAKRIYDVQEKKFISEIPQEVDIEKLSKEFNGKKRIINGRYIEIESSENDLSISSKIESCLK